MDDLLIMFFTLLILIVVAANFNAAMTIQRYNNYQRINIRIPLLVLFLIVGMHGVVWVQAKRIAAYVPPPPNNVIMIDVDRVLVKDGTFLPQSIAFLNKISKDTNSKLVLIDKEKRDIPGLTAHVISVILDKHECLTRDDFISLWLKGYPLDDVAGMAYISTQPTNNYSAFLVQLEFGSEFGPQHAETVSYMLKNSGQPKNLAIGEIKACESKVTNETSFGGQPTQEIPLPESEQVSRI